MRKKILLSVLLSLFLHPGMAQMPPYGQQPLPPASFQNEFQAKLRSIEALMSAYHSMADPGQFRQVENDLDGMVGESRQRWLAQDYIGSKILLDRAYDRVKQAVVAGRQGKTLTNSRGAGEQYQIRPSDTPSRSGYQARKESVDALYAAYIRVTEEKGLSGHGQTMARKLGELKQRADGMRNSGDEVTARAILEDAYTLVKAGLSSLRDGETLVRSLDFSGPDQEYAYYVEKIQSQKTAIEILLQLNDSPNRQSLLHMMLEGAGAQVAIAERKAAQGDYLGALPIMDRVFSRLQSGLMMSLSSE